MAKIQKIATVMVGCAGLIGAFTTTASATQMQDVKRIESFVDNVHALYGINLNAADYVVKQDPQGTMVVRKDQAASAKIVTTSRFNARTGKAETEASVETLVPVPTEAQAATLPAIGNGLQDDNTQWGQPACATFTHNSTDYNEPVGSATTCNDWGKMNYAGSTGSNVAYRQYNTCIAGWNPSHSSMYELTECGLDTQPYARVFTFNGFEPRSDLQVGGCTQLSFNIGYGPVSAGASFNACDTIDMEVDVNNAPMHEAHWRGEKHNAQREVAKLVALHSAKDGQSLSAHYGYSFHPCGSLGELCD